jgi:hypothetical protein
MLRVLIKFVISSLIIVLASELGKKSTILGSIIVTLPLTSIMTLCWLYRDTGNTELVMSTSRGILWFILPSLALFLVLPLLLKAGMKFPISMVLSCLVLVATYPAYLWILGKFGVTF